MRYMFLGLVCCLVVCRPAFAKIPLLLGRWQCHVAEHEQYLCEFRHGAFRLQLIPHYLDDHVDIRIIDSYILDEYGKPEDNSACIPHYYVSFGTFHNGMDYFTYKMSDMGHGACLYDLTPRFDVDDMITTHIENFKHIDASSIEYIAERIREKGTADTSIYKIGGDWLWQRVHVPFWNKEYLISGLFYWKRHPSEARKLAKLHPVIRHSWQCDWQKDGRFMCDVSEKDMHVMFYPKTDGKDVDVYIMTMVHSCPSKGISLGFVDKRDYFSDHKQEGNELYLRGVGVEPEDNLGGKWGCGYQLVPGESFPQGQSAIDVLSKNIMQHDMIDAEFYDGLIDAEPQGWETAIELTDRAGLVHALQYWKRKRAEMKAVDVKPTNMKPGAEKADLGPAEQNMP